MANDDEAKPDMATELKYLRRMLDDFLGGTAIPGGHLDIYMKDRDDAIRAAGEAIARAIEQAGEAIAEAITDDGQTLTEVLGRGLDHVAASR